MGLAYRAWDCLTGHGLGWLTRRGAGLQGMGLGVRVEYCLARQGAGLHTMGGLHGWHGDGLQDMGWDGLQGPGLVHSA